MLNPMFNSQPFEFADFNPSIIGQEIRWRSANERKDPNGEDGLIFRVMSYEEQSQPMQTADDITLIRTMLKINTDTGEQVTMPPHELFTTNFYNNHQSERFNFNASLAEYTYEFVGSEIIGNNVMVVTGKDSNHPWGQFITGKVISYTRSGARPMYALAPDSVFYEVGINAS